MDEFFRTYPAVGILLASGLLFLNGYHSLREGRRGVALQWQLVGAFMAFAFSIGALLSQMWFASLVAAALFAVEVCLMKRWFGGKPQ
jgi:heme/copper-type cytochrome/quinol oxidase subunit 3